MRSDERTARQIGHAFRRIRVERKKTQQVIANRAGLTKPTLSRYERGRACPPFPDLLKVLAALECSPQDFGRYFGPIGDAKKLPRCPASPA
ncbi:MAG TPA: helix-turn-helix transcriptional regulator [Thermoanaerobaculia bacterium]|nr:helix-turn-helix transcriptional regulator [Thermoanaerobaculia bacterium]